MRRPGATDPCPYGEVMAPGLKTEIAVVRLPTDEQ